MAMMRFTQEQIDDMSIIEIAENLVLATEDAREELKAVRPVLVDALMNNVEIREGVDEEVEVSLNRSDAVS